MTRKKIIFLAIISLLGITLLIGKLLDQEAERVVHQLYPRDNQGVIRGLNTIEYRNNHPRALILIHGFLDSPEMFHTILRDKNIRQQFDIYIPRLPYHAKDLETAAQLNNKILTTFLSNYINTIEKQYKHTTVLGLSYGGALTVNMLKLKLLPKQLKVILYAPAIYIRSNTFMGNISVYTYALWRNYCNYEFLGCQFPAYSSGDEQAQTFLENEQSLRYKVLSAIKSMYQLDRELRSYLPKIHRPFDLIIAKDDNRVSYQKLQAHCRKNPYCTLHNFPSGKHLPHLGKHQAEFHQLLLQLAASPTTHLKA